MASAERWTKGTLTNELFSQGAVHFAGVVLLTVWTIRGHYKGHRKLEIRSEINCVLGIISKYKYNIDENIIYQGLLRHKINLIGIT